MPKYWRKNFMDWIYNVDVTLYHQQIKFGKKVLNLKIQTISTQNESYDNFMKVKIMFKTNEGFDKIA